MNNAGRSQEIDDQKGEVISIGYWSLIFVFVHGIFMNSVRIVIMAFEAFLFFFFFYKLTPVEEGQIKEHHQKWPCSFFFSKKATAFTNVTCCFVEIVSSSFRYDKQSTPSN